MSEQQVQDFHAQIQTGAQATEEALTEIHSQLQSHDIQSSKATPAVSGSDLSNNNATATSYLQSAIDASTLAVAELRQVAEKLQRTPAGERAIHVAQDALAKVQRSMLTLKEQAAKYDESYQVSQTLQGASTSLTTTTTLLTTSVESIVEHSKARASQALQQANEQAKHLQVSLATKAGEAGNNAFALAGGVLKKVEEYDQHYHVSTTLTSAAAVVNEKAKEYDAYYGVTKKAMELDQQVTGGAGTRAVSKGTELLQSGGEYVVDTIHQAKEAASEPKTE